MSLPVTLITNREEIYAHLWEKDHLDLVLLIDQLADDLMIFEKEMFCL